jgi:eukaryotic-like serine/threonine-protein kinase
MEPDDLIALARLGRSPDGRHVAIAGNGEPPDGINLAHAAWVHIFDSQTLERVLKWRHGSARVEASAVAWSPDGKQIVTGDINGLAEVREMRTGRKVSTANLHTTTISALAWSPDGHRIASGSGDRSVCVWDPHSGEELMRFEEIPSEIDHVLWSANGRKLVAVTVEGSVYVWDAAKGYDFVASDDYFVSRSQHLTTTLHC